MPVPTLYTPFGSIVGWISIRLPRTQIGMLGRFAVAQNQTTAAISSITVLGTFYKGGPKTSNISDGLMRPPPGTQMDVLRRLAVAVVGGQRLLDDRSSFFHLDTHLRRGHERGLYGSGDGGFRALPPVSGLRDYGQGRDHHRHGPVCVCVIIITIGRANRLTNEKDVSLRAVKITKHF